MGWSGRMTWRQFRAYQEWVFEDLSVPGKTERYLMQGHEIAALKGSGQGGWDPERWKVKVVRTSAVPEPVAPPTKEEQDRASKEIAKQLFAMVGQGQLEIRKGGRRDG